MQNDYAAFLESKRQIGTNDGFKPLWLPDFLFDFQRALLEWAIEKGRDAIFADCGLGKTPMQLVWAENVTRHTNGYVLILTPLAVSMQTVGEGEKFGVGCHKYIGNLAGHKIIICNYEKLHKLDPNDFAGVVCDESSILKSFDGAYRGEITAFMRKIKYRLLCTATASPNDYTELGTSSEALGYLGHVDMLNRFFKNENNNSGTRRHFGEVVKWRMKHHAEEPFWRWVCSWARALRKPSDLGFDDSRFELPPLIEREHLVDATRIAEGNLFDMPAIGLREQREESRRTIRERCEKVSALVDDGQPALVWCNLNDEGDLLEELIPDAVQVSGSDREELKEERLLGFADGKFRVLITKPKIGAWGLNFQRCAHVVTFPTHSYEQYYQGVRRCWRFGQTRPVTVDIVATEGGSAVMKNLQRKSAAADAMFSRMIALMGQAQGVKIDRSYAQEERMPVWL